MLNIPVVRWGKPYESLDKEEMRHFLTGESVATLSQASADLIQRDMRRAEAARDTLRRIPCAELIRRMSRAAELYENATLPMGDGTQTVYEFVCHQSATTGLPMAMCRANMSKNAFVLKSMEQILECLTRGLDLNVLTRGYGVERGVNVSYQAQSPVLGAIFPSNSPSVHTLWLPVLSLQLGLVLNPGSREPWTPYRLFSAFAEADIPAEVLGLYPGGRDAGDAILNTCQRTVVFGGTEAVERYRGNPRVQVRGPGFSKILIGDDVVDHWEDYLDLMVESIYANAGRGCLNCSSVWASRHTPEIARALADRLGPVDVKPPDDPEAGLAAFTETGEGRSMWQMIEADLRQPGVTDLTSEFGDRLIERERCAYLRPVIAHCDSPEPAICRREHLFPFAAVVRCRQEEWIDRIGPTLACTALTRNGDLIRALRDATHVDRLNIGRIPTTRLNWLQPHEGNLIDFLFRSRAYQHLEF